MEVAETRQLPPMLIERYNAAAGEGTALCGIFSDIHRAWATVDNSFFVWRFDKWLANFFVYFFLYTHIIRLKIAIPYDEHNTYMASQYLIFTDVSSVQVYSAFPL